MGITIGVIVAVAVLGLAVYVYLRRNPRDDAGMTSFRRHIDALSPEARRDVIDRVRDHDDRKGNGKGSATPSSDPPAGQDG